MVVASQLRPGMAVRLEGKTYRVLGATYHAGQGKMGGVTHAQLKNLSTGTLLDQAFRADLRLEDLPIEKQMMEFLYSDGDQCCFMHPDTYEQLEVPASVIGSRARFLQPQMQVAIEFVEGRPVNVVFPETIDVAVTETHPDQSSTIHQSWRCDSPRRGKPQVHRAGQRCEKVRAVGLLDCLGRCHPTIGSPSPNKRSRVTRHTLADIDRVTPISLASQ
jgi:elongation factor P